MENNFDNKLTDIKKAEQDRRDELAMLDLLIKKYPKETAENYLAFQNAKSSVSLKSDRSDNYGNS